MSASLLLFITAGAVSYLLTSSRCSVTTWNGYYQLIFEESAEVELVGDLLKKNGISNFISETTEKFPVFSYGSPVYKTANRIKDYYVGNDPLYDPFLKGVPSYFHGYADGKKVNIIYIPEENSAVKTYVKIKKALLHKNIWWSMVEFQPLQRLSFILFALVLDFFLYLFFRTRKKFLFIALVSWLFPLVFGNLETLIAAAGCQFSWILASDQMYGNLKYYLNYKNLDVTMVRNGVTSLFFTLGITIAVFFLLNRNEGFLTILVSFAMMVTGTIFILTHLYYQHVARIHRLFFPVKIMAKRKRLRLDEMYAAGLFFLFLIFVPVLYQFTVSFEKVAVPAPYKLVDDKTISLESLNKVFTHSGDKHIPDLSDYVAHMAFIEGYPYGRAYRFPSRDEKVLIPVYKDENGFALRKNLMVKMFTDSWYESIITPGNANNLIAMLVGQKVPVGVKSVDIHRMASVRERFGTYYIYYVFLLIPFLFWGSGIVLFPEYKVKRLFIRRRRQVV